VGYQLLRTLIDLLATGGLAAIQVTFRQPSKTLRRLVRLARGRSRPIDRPLGEARPELQLPYSHIVGYEKHTVRRVIEAAGAKVLAQLPTDNREAAGAVMIVVKPLSEAKSA